MTYTLKDVVEAQLFAIQVHQGQYRKINKKPYIIHILRILEHLHRDFQGKELNKLKIIAALHDSIEDSWVSKQDIEKEFGKEIAIEVYNLSKNKELKQPLQEQEYRERLKNASDEAKIVKLLDIYDNCHDIKNVKEHKERWLKTIQRMEDNLEVLEVKNLDYKKRFNETKQELKEFIKLLKKSV